MGIYLPFTPGWLVVLGIIYGTYALILLLRKNRKKNDIKDQLKMGAVTLLFAFLVEFAGVSFKLWTYAPMNWPLAVWVGYFGVGLTGYQIFKKLEEKQ